MKKKLVIWKQQNHGNCWSETHAIFNYIGNYMLCHSIYELYKTDKLLIFLIVLSILPQIAAMSGFSLVNKMNSAFLLGQGKFVS